MTKLTITRAATEFGSSRDTITRGLTGLGIKVAPGKTYTIRQLYRAIAGDLKAERTRLAREQADAAARENRMADADLVKMSEVEARIMQALINPLREVLSGMATACSQLANPSDPQTAYNVIDGYLERTLKPHLRSKLGRL